MYQKLLDAFNTVKVIFKGLFQFFADLGLNVERAIGFGKEIEDMTDEIIDSGIPAGYID